MKARPSKTCVICGLRPATTDDHVPPKGIFPKPRPSDLDLITVRTCLSCNNNTSVLDEVFKVFIGIVGGHGPEGEKMYKEYTSRTLQHNRRLKSEIASTIHDEWVETPEGVSLGKRPAVEINSHAHDQIIEKIIRGLHFHHTGEIIADHADINVNWDHSGLTRDMYNMFVGWPTCVVGGGQFIYKYMVSPHDPFTSVWIFRFFSRVWSNGTVLPKGTRMVEQGGGCVR